MSTVELSPPIVHDAITFEAWNGSDVVPQHVLMALVADDASVQCNSGSATSPINVLVRISACYSSEQAEGVDTWVKTSLAGKSPPRYVDGVEIPVKFFTQWVASSGCVAPTTSFSFLQTTSVTAPTVVITFAKAGDAVTSVPAATGYSLTFRLCPATGMCGSTTTEVALVSLDDLSNFSPTSISRYFACTATTGAVAVPYVSSNGKEQCVCVCPSGSTLASGGCVQSASSHGTCPWPSQTSGYTCNWSSSTKTKLALVADCAVAVPVPKDNYVADGRTNQHDGENPLPSPKVSVKATRGSTVVSFVNDTWSQYSSNPSTELAKVSFVTYGVYNLEIAATDYSSNAATCSSCVAVVDDFPPQAIAACATSTTSTSPAADIADLTAVVAQEDSYYAFSSDSNTRNNVLGTSTLNHARTHSMKDFFAAGYSALVSTSDRCFSSSLAQSLLSKPGAKISPFTAGTDLNSLQCTRCCSKKTVLQENYFPYSCSTAEAATTALTHGADECNFNRCVTIPGTSLISASVTIKASADTLSNAVVAAVQTTKVSATIYRSIACTNFGPGCSFTDTIGNLFTLSQSWQSTLANDDSHFFDAFSASDYAFWRYQIKGVWAMWNASTSVSFTDASTDVLIQGYTQCGKVAESTFVVKLFAHNERHICSAFKNMLYQAPTNQLTRTNAICAYPDSDFAPLVVQYSSDQGLNKTAGTVSGSVTRAECSIKVAVAGTNMSTVASLPLISGSPANGSTAFDLLKYFGVELINSPTTVENTEVYIYCAFTYHYYGETDTSKDVADLCPITLTLTDCEAPYVEDKASPSVCAVGNCSGTSSHGPFESCGGTVFTNAGTTTALKSWTQCCSDCSTTKQLSCDPFLGLPGTPADSLKRCEPHTKTVLIAEAPTADENTEGEVDVASEVLFGAIALVAVVATVLTKRRAEATTHTLDNDDEYYTLLS